MSFFEDKKAREKVEFLELERQKLWGRVVALEKRDKELQILIERRATDDEKEAAQSSKKAAEFKNKTEKRLEESFQIVDSIQNLFNTAHAKLDDIKQVEASILNLKEEIGEIKLNVEESQTELLDDVTLLEEKISIFNDFYENYPDLTTELQEIESNILKIQDNVSKSNQSVSALNKKKQDVDILYREVFGYKDTDEEGKEILIEGLKDQLELSYDEVAEKVEESLDEIKSLSEKYHKSYSDFQKEHKDRYDAINKEISSLLPNALTAGLSAAFSSKKDEEVQSADNLQKKFSMGIYMLIGVSAIPFIISVYFLSTNVSLNEVISRLPRLVLAIIPMYIPVLWFTYSANKKLNLSKRLIEEYSHKEVLSRTYEGLSKQITGLNNDEQSMELKYRLLSNFLQVSSENPGKLISNYESSDHPVMEALEQSYKFQVAIDKLEGVPGLGKVAALLESRAKKKMSKKNEVIEKAMGFDDEKSDES